MKKKSIIVLAIVLILAIGIVTWYKLPVRCVNLDPADVEEIVIFDGNTGKKLNITEEDVIERIIENLNSVKLRRGKLSGGYIGFRFDTTIHLKDGKKANGWNKFIINGSNAVRKDPFFYSVTEGTIDYEYIEQLVRGQA